MNSQKILETLLSRIFKKKVVYISVGHADLARNMVYSIPDQRKILKIYGQSQCWEREIASLNHMLNRKLRVPRLVDYGTHATKVYWVLMTELDGKILAKVQYRLTRAEYLKLMVKIGRFHAGFHHACRLDSFGDWDRRGKTWARDSGYRTYTGNNNRITADSVLAKGYPETGLFMAARERMVALEYTLTDCNRFSLCHNDFGERNILVTEKADTWHLSGVIDFESSYPADPESDLARIFLDIFHTEDMEYYLAGYTQICPLSQQFRRKIIYYLYALCFAICQWSYQTDYIYYCKAVQLMRRLVKI